MFRISFQIKMVRKSQPLSLLPDEDQIEFRKYLIQIQESSAMEALEWSSRQNYVTLANWWQLKKFYKIDGLR